MSEVADEPSSSPAGEGSRPPAVEASAAQQGGAGATIAATLLVFCVFALHGGWPIPDVNEAHYLAKIKHAWEPGWIVGDMFLDSADAHFVFTWLFGPLTLFLPLPAVAWIGRVATWILQAWAWQRLSRAIVPGVLWPVLSAAALTALNARFHLSGEWVVGGFEAKGLAYALAWLGLERAVRGRWNPAFLLLGAASALHVLVGGWWTLAVGLAWLVRGRRQTPLRGILPGLAGGFLISLAGLIPALALSWGAPPEIVRPANLAYVVQRLGHHLDPRQFSLGHYLRHAALLIAWIVVGRLVSKPQDNSASLEDRSWPVLSATVWASVLFLGLGLAAGLLWYVDVHWAARLLRFYWFRAADVLLPLGVALGLVKWLAMLRAPSHSFPVGRAAWADTALLTVIALAALHPIDLMLQRRNGQPRPDSFTSARQHAAWREACLAAQTLTPPDALFLVPKAAATFRWYAERPTVVVWKDVPQDAASIVEWRLRTRAVYGETAVSGRRSLADLGEEHIAATAARYGAGYLIVENQRPLDFRLLYENRDFALYRLPPK